MAESKLRNLSDEFSVKIIKLCENIKGEAFCNIVILQKSRIGKPSP